MSKFTSKFIQKLNKDKTRPENKKLREDVVLKLHQTVILSDASGWQDALQAAESFLQHNPSLSFQELLDSIPEADEEGKSLLYRAIEDNHLDRALQILKLGASPQSSSTLYHSTPMHMLVQRISKEDGWNTNAVPPERKTLVFDLFHSMLAKGEKEKNKRLLDAKDAMRRSALIIAAESNRTDVAEWLLAGNADPNVLNNKGETPLHIAVRLGNQRLAKALLRSGALAAMKGPQGTCREMAEKRGDEGLLRLLNSQIDSAISDASDKDRMMQLTRQQSITAKQQETENKRYLSAIHSLRDNGADPEVILEKICACITELSEERKTLQKSSVHLADGIQQSGAHLQRSLSYRNYRGSKDVDDEIFLILSFPFEEGMVALHLASRSGKAEAVQLLLKHKANPNVQDKRGWTPLHFACREGHLHVIEILLGIPTLRAHRGSYSRVRSASDISQATSPLPNRANISIHCEGGNTPFHYLCGRSFDLDSVERARRVYDTFLSQGQDVNRANERQETPLHRASQNGSILFSQWLLASNALVDVRTTRKETPLHYAARTGNLCVALLLIRHGADPSASGNNGTPADVAYASQQWHVVAFFKADDPHSRSRAFRQFLAWNEAHGLSTLLHKRMEDENNLKEVLTLLNTPLEREFETNKNKQDSKALESQSDEERKSTVFELQGYPLHISISHGSVSMVQTLLDFNADIDQADVEGNRPVIIAARGGHWRVCEELLKRGADADCLDKKGRSVLHYLAMTLTKEEVKRKKAAQQNQLLLAVWGPSVGPAKIDLPKQGWESSPIDSGLWDSVFTLALQKSVDAAEILGRGLRSDCNCAEGTPLHCACLYRNEYAVERLLNWSSIALPEISITLESTIQANSTNSRGLTPLHLAVQNTDERIVSLLLSHGANPRLEQEEQGKCPTPLEMAYHAGNDFVVELLLEEDEEYLRSKLKRVLNNYTFKDIRRLLKTAERKQYDVKEMVNSPCHAASGKTPLHASAAAGKLSIVRLLIDLEADPNVLDSSNRAPVHLAAAGDHLHTCHLLLERGSKVDFSEGDRSIVPVDSQTSTTERITRYTSVLHYLAGLGVERSSERKETMFLILERLKEVIISQHRAKDETLSEEELKRKVQDYLNRPHSFTLESPLHRSCLTSQLSTACWLLENGANPCTSARGRITPLMVAVMLKNQSLVELLLQYGAGSSLPIRSESLLAQKTTELKSSGSGISNLAVETFARPLRIMKELRKGFDTGYISSSAFCSDEQIQTLAAFYGLENDGTQQKSEEGQTVLELCEAIDKPDSALLKRLKEELPGVVIGKLQGALMEARNLNECQRLLSIAGYQKLDVKRIVTSPIGLMTAERLDPRVPREENEDSTPGVHSSEECPAMQQNAHHNGEMNEGAGSRGSKKLLVHGLSDSHSLALVDERWGMHPLHCAALTGKFHLVQLLLSYGANVGGVDSQGNSPLHLAMQNAHLPIVELLLEHGANSNQLNKNMTSPLHYLAGSKRLSKMMKTTFPSSHLLEEIVKKEKEDREVGQSSPTTRKVSEKDEKECDDEEICLPLLCYVLEMIIVKDGYCLHQQNLSKETVLHRAVLAQNTVLARYFLERKVDPNRTNKRGETALHYACRLNNFTLVQLLVHFGADRRIEGPSGLPKMLTTSQKIIDFLAGDNHSLSSIIRTSYDHSVAEAKTTPAILELVPSLSEFGVEYMMCSSKLLQKQTSELSSKDSSKKSKQKTGLVESPKLVDRAYTSVTKIVRNKDRRKQEKTAGSKPALTRKLNQTVYTRKDSQPNPVGLQRSSSSMTVLRSNSAESDEEEIMKQSMKRWEVRVAPSGTPYYCDLKTRRIFWLLPSRAIADYYEEHPDEAVDIHRLQAAHEHSEEMVDLNELLYASDTISSDSMQVGTLPRWEKRMHFSGQPYYVDKLTGKVSWDLPSDVHEEDVVSFDEEVLDSPDYGALLGLDNLFDMNPTDPNDPAYHYLKIKFDPRFQDLLVKHCPTWFTAQGAKQNLLNMVDISNVPGISLAVKIFRAGDQYHDVHKLRKVVSSVEDDPAMHQVVDTMQAGMRMEAAKKTANVAISIAFKALLFAIPLESLIPGYFIASNAAGWLGSKVVEKAFAPISSELIAFGIDEAMLTAMQSELSTIVTNVVVGSVQKVMKQVFTRSTQESAKYAGLFLAEAGITHGVDQTSMLASKTLLKYHSSRAFLKYLGYPEDKSDVYAQWEASRLFLKSLYGAGPDENLFIMQPSVRTELQLQKQDLTLGAYDTGELGDKASLLWLLWRAYDCWDALNYAEKASRAVSQVVSLATGTHLSEREFDKQRRKHARLTFFDVNDPHLVRLSAEHSDELCQILIRQWMNPKSILPRILFKEDNMSPRLLEWLARCYIGYSVRSSQRIWGFMDDENQILAAIFFQPSIYELTSISNAKPKRVTRFSKYMKTAFSPDSVLLGINGFKSLLAKVKKLEKLKEDRIASVLSKQSEQPMDYSYIQLCVVDMDRYSQGSEQESGTTSTTTTSQCNAVETQKSEHSTSLVGRLEKMSSLGLVNRQKKAKKILSSEEIVDYQCLLDGYLSLDTVLQEYFNFQVIGSDPIGAAHVISLYRAAGVYRTDSLQDSQEMEMDDD